MVLGGLLAVEGGRGGVLDVLPGGVGGEGGDPIENDGTFATFFAGAGEGGGALEGKAEIFDEAPVGPGEPGELFGECAFDAARFEVGDAQGGVGADEGDLFGCAGDFAPAQGHAE